MKCSLHPWRESISLDAGMFLQEEMFPDLLVAPIFSIMSTVAGGGNLFSEIINFPHFQIHIVSIQCLWFKPCWP